MLCSPEGAVLRCVWRRDSRGPRPVSSLWHFQSACTSCTSPVPPSNPGHTPVVDSEPFKQWRHALSQKLWKKRERLKKKISHLWRVTYLIKRGLLQGLWSPLHHGMQGFEHSKHALDVALTEVKTWRLFQPFVPHLMPQDGHSDKFLAHLENTKQKFRC